MVNNGNKGIDAESDNCAFYLRKYSVNNLKIIFIGNLTIFAKKINKHESKA
jgi:hypothetical protein